MKFAKYTLLTLAGPAMILMLGGCAGSRWLSRNDYSAMHDPFADMQTADSSTDSGRVQGAERGAVSLGGPKPLGSTIAEASARGRGNSVTQASYPDDGIGRTTVKTADRRITDSAPPSRGTGPALSDFLGKNSASSLGGLITPGPKTAAESLSSLSAANSGGSPVGIPAGVTHAELDAFDKFVQAQSVGTNSPQTPAKPPRPAPNQRGATATDSVAAGLAEEPFGLQSSGIVPSLSAGANETRPSVLRRSTDNFPASDLPPAFDVATPSSDSATSSSASPFDNPFADLGAPTNVAAATPSRPQRTPAPAAFEMDSGWKPANFTRP